MLHLLKPLGWTMLAALLLTACQSRKIDNTLLVDPDEAVSFSQDVLPIFTTSCGGGGCHIDQSVSGVNLSSYQHVVNSQGQQYGEHVVLPDDAANSPLIDKLRPDPRFGGRMPPDRSPLSAEQIALIRTWIDEGAPDD